MNEEEILHHKVGEVLEQTARETVSDPFLQVWKAMSDGALNNLIQWKLSLPVAGGMGLGDLLGPFQPKPFCVSVTSVVKLSLQVFLCIFNISYSPSAIRSRGLHVSVFHLHNYGK